jgi:hypothetical protein
MQTGAGRRGSSKSKSNGRNGEAMSALRSFRVIFGSVRRRRRIVHCRSCRFALRRHRDETEGGTAAKLIGGAAGGFWRVASVSHANTWRSASARLAPVARASL